MTRWAIIACALATLGCAPGVRTAELPVVGITTRDLTVRVRLSGIGGDSVALHVRADVVARGAAWAALMRPLFACPGQFGCQSSISGPARRIEGDHAALESPSPLSLGACSAGVCEIDYVVRLDTVPTHPWDVVLSATVDGGAQDDALVEIVQIAAP